MSEVVLNHAEVTALRQDFDEAREMIKTEFQRTMTEYQSACGSSMWRGPAAASALTVLASKMEPSVASILSHIANSEQQIYSAHNIQNTQESESEREIGAVTPAVGGGGMEFSRL